MTAERKQARYAAGMVYAVPLTDGSFGVAQAGEPQGNFINVIYVTLFSQRYVQRPALPPALSIDAVVSLSATWRQALNRGGWLALGVAPALVRREQFPNEQFAAQGYVGAKHYDAGILAEFLSAWHGFLPWNVMHDPSYFDRLLLAGQARPGTAQVLSESERASYRRDIMKIGS